MSRYYHRYNASYICWSLGGELADLSNDELREAAVSLYNKSAVFQWLDVAGGMWIGLHANRWRPVVNFFEGTLVYESPYDTVPFYERFFIILAIAIYKLIQERTPLET